MHFSLTRTGNKIDQVYLIINIPVFSQSHCNTTKKVVPGIQNMNLTKNEPLKPHQRWNQQLVSMSIILLIVLASINYLVDPYQVFHSNTFYPSATSNERFNKVEYLLNHKKQYNAFLLGSSRMGVFDPRWFNHDHTHYYNLSVFSGDAKDSLQMLMLLKEKGIHIKEVILGLDLFPFIEKHRTRPASLQHHPLVTGVSYANYYVKHLFNSSLYQSYLKLEQHYGQRSFTFNYTTGQWSLNAMDDLRDKDPAKYHQRFFSESSRPPMTVNFQERRFIGLKRLITWLKNNSTKTRIFIHPFSHLHQNRFAKDTFKELRQRIKLIAPEAYDFSVRLNWTYNTANYYEKKHYRVRLARKIVLVLKRQKNQYIVKQRP